MHIEALCIVTFGPRHDVGSSKQRGIGDPGNWAEASPIIHQRAAEDVLADALDDEALGLGRLRQVGGLRAKAGERASGRLTPSL